MPEGYSTTAKNTMLDALTPDTVSLHTADPGAAGTANEVSGGSPAYARKAITFAAASGGARDSSSQPVFDVPGGGTSVGWISFWNGATFLGSKQISAEVFTNQGTMTLSDADLTLT